MMPLKQQAIETALLGSWDKAIELNEEILKENPDDIETLNRLAFAYAAIQNAKFAKATYQKVLQLDNQNPIALKNLKRLSENNNGNTASFHSTFVDLSQLQSMFIEETGKTKILDLINVAPPQILSRLVTGEQLSLRIKRLKIFVLDGKSQYVGMLPDDIGKRLIKFLKGGNTYQACVKAVNKNLVTLFVKEVKRATRFKDQPSFITIEKQKVTTKSKNTKDDADEEE